MYATHTQCLRATHPTRRAGAACQHGYATLTISIVMLLIISLMTIYATRSGVLDIRTSADRVRYAEAMALAEQLVEEGFAWAMANRDKLDMANWDIDLDEYKSCVGSPTSVPCGDGNTNRYDNTYLYQCHGNVGELVDCDGIVTYYIVAKIPAAGATQTNFDIVAQADWIVAQNLGKSLDRTAKAVVKQGIYFYRISNPDELPSPFTAAGNITLQGNYHLVTNPNGGGTGVPVSVWTPDAVVLQGTPATCQLYEFTLNGNTCPNDSTQLSGSTNGVGADVVANAANFPADLFEFVFSVPTANYQTIKNQAIPLASCNSLNASSKGIYWINADCSPPGDVGSAAHPVILVVQEGDFHLTGNVTFYGILFSFSPTGNAGDIDLNGGATIYGSVISNDDTVAGKTINGTFKLVYDPDTMGNIFTTVETMGLAKLPGSWTDYLD